MFAFWLVYGLALRIEFLRPVKARKPSKQLDRRDRPKTWIKGRKRALPRSPAMNLEVIARA